MYTDGALLIEQLMPVAYKHVIKSYLRYVLIKCAKYTNDKREVERIAVFSLAMTCALAKKVRYIWQLGQVIDCMADAAGRDVAKNEPRGEGNEQLDESAVFLANKRIQEVAKAVNMLDWFALQVLVFRHVEMMSKKEISQIFKRSILSISSAVNKAEQALTGHLAGLWEDTTAISAEDVCLWMDELDEALDMEQRARVAKSVLSCVGQF